MHDRDDDSKRQRGPGPLTRASIPGDPFPWEPEIRGSADAEGPATPAGSTPSPADSGDPTSFDLGGGD
jgi:hypothetical protein